ncbi:hypothetical protein TNCV_735801 [Trichonephila clavipes]|uniref:Uncharacterized protein n=1 Tax=Trichonephila clavipes TaxID=2585209 RepID=A0A8X6VPS2_TRICX|nr:hypothetical protein TNCV_735801 [Trichonephila clavipes]
MKRMKNNEKNWSVFTIELKGRRSDFEMLLAEIKREKKELVFYGYDPRSYDWCCLGLWLSRRKTILYPQAMTRDEIHFKRRSGVRGPFVHRVLSKSTEVEVKVLLQEVG